MLKNFVEISNFPFMPNCSYNFYIHFSKFDNSEFCWMYTSVSYK